MNQPPKKILVIRNDKLGDFMLAFPALFSLKLNMPQTEIHALVPSYTSEIAEACSAIDHIIIDHGENSSLHEHKRLLREIKNHQYDAVLTLFSTTRIGIIAWLAGIPYRYAPATKIAQLFYNRKLRQHRSQSAKPEFAYNLDLTEMLLREHEVHNPKQSQPPYLHFADAQVKQLHIDFCNRNSINPKQLLVFIHPGSGGSANNLSPEQFATLASRLTSKTGHTIVISSGPGDEGTAYKVSTLLPDTPHVVYKSEQGLRRFAEHIQFASLFIGGSTGPLHIAGALDRPTAGFYTRRQSATSLRWQTLNSETNRLAFSPPDNAEPEDMSAIDIVAAAERINRTFLAD